MNLENTFIKTYNYIIVDILPTIYKLLFLYIINKPFSFAVK